MSRRSNAANALCNQPDAAGGFRIGSKADSNLSPETAGCGGEIEIPLLSIISAIDTKWRELYYFI
jgi:hypothetical protein